MDHSLTWINEQWRVHCVSLTMCALGEDRIMLGTDYPFPLGEVLISDTFPGKVITQSKFSETIQVIHKDYKIIYE